MKKFVSTLMAELLALVIFGSVLLVPLEAQDISLGVDGTISTVVGPTNSAPPNVAGYSGDGGPANQAMLDNPTGIAFDSAGNLYIADYKNNVVRKVDTNGLISTIAGNYALGAGYSGDGGPATKAQLDHPSGLAFDKSGNLYIVDNGNSVIRRVDSHGTITTIAGNYNAGAGYSGDGAPATSAQLNLPLSIAFDAAGNLYISDTANNVIRKVNTQGIISTVAGNVMLGAGYSGDGGPATKAQLNYPAGLTFDSDGNIYVADQRNNVIRIINTSGTITTFAGDGTGSYDGDGGPAVLAGLNQPLSVAIDASGNVYIADYANQVIRRVDPSGTITTIAGYRLGSTAAFSSNYGPCYPPDPGSEDEGDGGPASWACLGGAFGLAFDQSGDLYFADAPNNSIRKITMPSTSSAIFPPTRVGSSSSLNITVTNISPNTSGISIPAIALKTNTPEFSLSSPPSNGCPLTGSITLPISGSCTLTATFTPARAGLRTVALSLQDQSNTFPFDTYSLQGVGVGPVGLLDSGTIFAIAGNVKLGLGYSGIGGPATAAQLPLPGDVATDSHGNLYIYTWNGVLEKVDPEGFIATVAGGAAQVCPAATDSVGDGCPATQAIINGGFAGIAIDGAGNVYISDAADQRVRKIDAATGIITTVAGNGYSANGHGGYSGDGGPATGAELDFPAGLALDTKGDLYIAEMNNCDIRRVDTNGVITTVAGTPQQCGYGGDGGPATAAKLGDPWSVKVDASGNLYIADAANFVVRKVDTGGTITTVAGTPGISGYAGDGGPATASLLTLPTGIALDLAGDLYISDTGSQVIRKVDPSGVISTVVGGVEHLCSAALDSIGDGCLATQAKFNTLLSGHVNDKGPNGITLDPNGDLFIADVGDSVVREVMPISVLEFGGLPVADTSSLTTYLFNTGNAPLHLASASPFVISGSNPSDFAASSGIDHGCSANMTVAPGSFCTISVAFKPAAAGSREAELQVSTDATNSGSVAAVLSGKGTILSSTSTAVGTSSTNLAQGANVTLTATVTPASGSGSPTGSVSFYDGTSLLASTLVASSGTASYSTSTLPLGSNSITADYEGDAYFSSSTSPSVVVTVHGPSFSLSNGGGITVTPGGSANNSTSTITVTPEYGFTGTVKLSCAVSTTMSNPVDPPTCSIPSSVSISGSTAGTATLTVNTTASSSNSASNVPLDGPSGPAGGVTLGILSFFAVTARKRKPWLGIGIFFVLMTLAVAGVGCGGGAVGTGGTGGSSGSAGTTPGSYSITVTGVSGSLSETTAVSLTVN